MKFFIKQYTATNDRSLRKISGLITGSVEDIFSIFFCSLKSPKMQRICYLKLYFDDKETIGHACKNNFSKDNKK